MPDETSTTTRRTWPWLATAVTARQAGATKPIKDASAGHAPERNNRGTHGPVRRRWGRPFAGRV